jgi:leucyl/phenylalanyl-tRNA---protein transferase
MPVFRLTEDLVFPRPELARADGLLAVGGDLSSERILLAYSLGIFPWYSECSPILWWSPDPRLVLFPDELKVSRSLRQAIKKGTFEITIDSAFEEVIRNCSGICREGQQGTWITEEMIEAYIRLYHAGYAHSVETRHNGELVGGLYGIAMGRAFFGESMFAKMSNASKIALVELIEHLNPLGFEFVDCQITTEHLKSLGARELPRSEFLRILKKALGKKIS